MAIRQRFSGFHLASLTSLFGCGDETLVERSVEMLSRWIDPGPDFEEGSRLVADIILGGKERVHPEVESELPQYVVACLAEFEQIHEISQSMFWETFVSAVRSGRLRLPPDLRPPLDWLVRGRPFFGQSLDPNGVGYSYLTHEEVQPLFENLLKSSALSASIGYREAEPWMARIIKNKKDVWFVRM